MTITTDRLVAQRVLVRDMPDRSRILATLRIEQYGGNAYPHFSATCEIYDARSGRSGAARSRSRAEADRGGADHVAILDAFPGARAFVALHLATYPDGVPMHAVANAWYLLTGAAERHERESYGREYTERLGSPSTRAARTLRCDPREIPYDLASIPPAERARDEHRDTFGQFVDTLRPRWAREARAARALLDIMPDVTDLRGYSMTGDAIDRAPLPEWLIGADPETVDV